jgi:hypothetical protein
MLLAALALLLDAPLDVVDFEEASVEGFELGLDFEGLVIEVNGHLPTFVESAEVRE